MPGTWRSEVLVESIVCGRGKEGAFGLHGREVWDFTGVYLEVILDCSLLETGKDPTCCSWL